VARSDGVTTTSQQTPFAQQYRAALLAFLRSGGDESALLDAYDTGRAALALGLSVFDLTAAHHAALLASTLGPLFQEPARRLSEDGERFLAQALVPFEIVTRGVSEVNAQLLTQNEALERRVEARTAELLTSERRFRALIEKSADAVSLVGNDGRAVYASPSVRPLFGYAPEAFLGPMAPELVHPDDLEATQALIAGVRAAPERSVTGECRLRHVDGAWRWVAFTATNLLDDPDVGAIVYNFRDVTASRAAAAALQRAAERLRELNEFARALGGSLDLQSVCRFGVGQTAALLGTVRCTVSQYDTAAQTLRVLAAAPPARPAPGGVAAAAGVEAAVMSAVLAGPAEGPGVVPSLLVVQDAAGAPAVTRERMAAAGLGSLLVAPITVDGAPWGALLAGFAAPGEATPDQATFLAGLAAHLAVAVKNAAFYSELARTTAAVRAEAAERERAEAVVRDINRRLRDALDELATSQEQAVQQERLRALGEMASGIAHDFNNALSPVVGLSELLLNNPALLADPVAVQRYLVLIHTGGRDAAATVRRLSEFYRPREAGEGVVPVDAHRLLADVIALTQPRWKDQAQGEGHPVLVTADLVPVPPMAGRAEELREALTNLVFNAVDALPQGGTITLRARPDPAVPPTSSSRIILEVQDDGVGMPEAVRRRCLEPFFTTKGKRGTGLGLAMVYGVVRRHSGELEIDSVPGQGTTVRLKVPAYAAPAAQDVAPRANGTPAAIRSLRVLVVDDEPLVRETTAAYLTADGHRVRTAAGGHEAVGTLGKEPFDLVVTDRAMPDLSGDTVARAAAALGAPVILLTGFGDLMAATGERVPGVDRVLAKPVSAASLRAAIAAVVTGAPARRSPVRPRQRSPRAATTPG
jgi:PAS domain S-box-containing protein